ncbi:helix-turn-helix domain-containing protein [Pseudomonas zeae]|uniref:helix-turn-helix domain-containing protein n=1 Tax=Pseudomonas zeae TaxID=2745510 RepID=UPI0039DF2DDE
MSITEEKHLAAVVGRAIARQRKRCGLTQNEVAERLGVSFDVVSRTERGIVMPNIARLMQLAAIFDCETAELLTETSTRSTDQASRMADLISGLNHAERLLIMSMVEQLVTYMKQK